MCIFHVGNITKTKELLVSFKQINTEVEKCVVLVKSILIPDCV